MRLNNRIRWPLGIAAALLAAALCALQLWLRLAEAPTFESVRARFTPSTAYLVDRHGEVLDSLRVDFGVRRLQWVPLDAVSPALINAVIEGEDRRFYRHGGVDWRAVPAALYAQSVRGHARGASTISMQLASMLSGQRRGGGAARNWSRKWSQVRMAHALESGWSKRQILEAYLNLLEFRGELQGIGAAAQVLAGKSPAGLSVLESQVLAALLPEPGAAAARIAARACARERQHSPSADCTPLRATAEQLFRRGDRSAPEQSLAPHLSAALLDAPGERVQTTLDAGIQRAARDILRSHLSELAERNVRDGAVIVVDNASGEVLAYVGSAGPTSRARQVDGVRAQRQAGSTLKPFLYEMALEQRYLTAASLLDDSPLNLDTGTGVYIPQDYDHDFKGLVSVRTALGSSLNVPAVRALVLVGVERFRDRLHDLGYAGINQDGAFYGFSLALGSAEVSLWEQAQAYRVLARGGRWSPLRLRMQEPRGVDRSALPADASFVIADILSDRAARAMTFGLDNHLNTAFWSAAKTGTSKDMRDNWCVGFSRQYTVAVWVGNFEGDAMHDVSGVTGAAPVWHDLMNRLQQNVASLPPIAPDGVQRVAMRFSPAVEPARQEWFLDGTQTAEIAAVPLASKVARITSPANGMIIAIDPDIPLTRQRVPITAQGIKSGMRITLNDTLLGPAGRELYWIPAAGTHHLALQDGAGHTLDRILVTVR